MHHRLVPALLIAVAATAAAQTSPTSRASRFLADCDHNGNRQEHFCEVRDATLPATALLDVDGRANGGVQVHGWDKNEIVVVAMIQTNADTQAEAAAMAKAVRFLTNGSQVRADGPEQDRGSSWSVSYDVWAPRQTNLAVNASNGGISVDGMASKMTLETSNGGIALSDVHGDVKGRTVNGGISAELTGDRWLGAGLDLVTTNGGVRLVVPQNYSANLETSTENGSVNVDFPITVNGRWRRSLTTTLGTGGAPVRATTTNGGVTIRHP